MTKKTQAKGLTLRNLTSRLLRKEKNESSFI